MKKNFSELGFRTVLSTFLVLVSAMMFACGVKAPPLAPIHDPLLPTPEPTRTPQS
jgi:hypothetical protein